MESGCSLGGIDNFRAPLCGIELTKIPVNTDVNAGPKSGPGPDVSQSCGRMTQRVSPLPTSPATTRRPDHHKTASALELLPAGTANACHRLRTQRNPT